MTLCHFTWSLRGMAGKSLIAETESNTAALNTSLIIFRCVFSDYCQKNEPYIARIILRIMIRNIDMLTQERGKRDKVYSNH